MADIHETETYNRFQEVGYAAKSCKTAVFNFMESYASATGRQLSSDLDWENVYVDVEPISSSRASCDDLAIAKKTDLIVEMDDRA